MYIFYILVPLRAWGYMVAFCAGDASMGCRLGVFSLVVVLASVFRSMRYLARGRRGVVCARARAKEEHTRAPLSARIIFDGGSAREELFMITSF